MKQIFFIGMDLLKHYVFILNMYNTALIAHNILLTASQDIDLLVKCKIPYVNSTSKYSVYTYRVMS
jgi:hypothetical protein